MKTKGKGKKIRESYSFTYYTESTVYCGLGINNSTLRGFILVVLSIGNSPGSVTG